MPEVARRRPLPDSPDLLRVLLEEASRASEHQIAIIAAIEGALEAHAGNDQQELARQADKFFELIRRDHPTTRNIADHLHWPFDDGGPLRLDIYKRWQTQKLARHEQGWADVARSHALVFERLRKQILKKLAGEPEDAPLPEPDDCPVQLLGRDAGPIILRRQQPTLSPSQYTVVQALVDAYPSRLSLSQLRGQVRRLTGKKDAGSPHKRIGELVDLANSEWRFVIVRPGSKNRTGYGLIWPDNPDLVPISP